MKTPEKGEIVEMFVRVKHVMDEPGFEPIAWVEPVVQPVAMPYQVMIVPVREVFR